MIRIDTFEKPSGGQPEKNHLQSGDDRKDHSHPAIGNAGDGELLVPLEILDGKPAVNHGQGGEYGGGN